MPCRELHSKMLDRAVGGDLTWWPGVAASHSWAPRPNLFAGPLLGRSCLVRAFLSPRKISFPLGPRSLGPCVPEQQVARLHKGWVTQS